MIEEKTMEEVQKAHPGADLEILEHDGDEVIVKSPGAGEYKVYKSMLADEKQRAMANESLVCKCVVYPATSGLQALLARKPGLSDTFGNELAAMAGLAGACTRKKLPRSGTKENTTSA